MGAPIAPPAPARARPAPSPTDLSIGSVESVADFAPGAHVAPLVAPGLPTLKGYEFIREIARGGMGEVYLARQTRLDRRVAIKRILASAAKSQHAVARFINEAKTLAKLKHPYVVSVIDVEQDSSGSHYLIMDYVEGGTLLERIQEGISENEAIRLMCMVCEGICYAHEHQILHRDIKPANILISAAGKPIIVDFGLAQAADGIQRTTQGQALGTLFYMAPEQRRDAANVDQRADVYSLGKTLYHVVTGKLPETVRIDRLSPALGKIVGTALEEERGDRYPTVAAMLADLKAIAQASGTDSRRLTQKASSGTHRAATENASGSLRRVNCPECGGKYGIPESTPDNANFRCKKCDLQCQVGDLLDDVPSGRHPAARPGKRSGLNATSSASRRLRQQKSSNAPVVLGIVAALAALGAVGFMATRAKDASEGRVADRDHEGEPKSSLGSTAPSRDQKETPPRAQGSPSGGGGRPKLEAEPRADFVAANGTKWRRVAGRPEGIGFDDPWSHVLARRQHASYVDSTLTRLQSGVFLELVHHGDSPIRATSLGVFQTIGEDKTTKDELAVELVRFESKDPLFTDLRGVENSSVYVMRRSLKIEKQGSSYVGRYQGAGFENLKPLDAATALQKYGARLRPGDSVVAIPVFEQDQHESPDRRFWTYEGTKSILVHAETVPRESYELERGKAQPRSLFERLVATKQLEKSYGNVYGLWHHGYAERAGELTFVWTDTPKLGTLPPGIEPAEVSAELPGPIGREGKPTGSLVEAPARGISRPGAGTFFKGAALESAQGVKWSVVSSLPQEFVIRNPYSDVARARRKLAWEGSSVTLTPAGIPIQVIDPSGVGIKVEPLGILVGKRGETVHEAVEFLRITTNLPPSRARIKAHFYECSFKVENSAAGASGYYGITSSSQSPESPSGALSEYGIRLKPGESVFAFDLLQARPADYPVDSPRWHYSADSLVCICVEVDLFDEAGSTIRSHHGEIFDAWRRQVPRQANYQVQVVWDGKPEFHTQLAYAVDPAKIAGPHFPAPLQVRAQAETPVRPNQPALPGPTPSPKRSDPELLEGLIELTQDEDKGEFRHERTGLVFVRVEPGTFTMGMRGGVEAESPAHRVRISQAYYFGKYEVTWLQYRAFCQETGRKPPTARYAVSGIHPVHSVSWQDATNFSEWAGTRLPTEAEWEFAARGSDGRAYPWGNSGATSEYANSQGRDGYKETCPVTSLPKGKSASGALHMGGNLWEWVADRYGSYSAMDQVDPTGPSSGNNRVLRGGSWAQPPEFCRATARAGGDPSAWRGSIGFRVAVSASQVKLSQEASKGH